MKNFMKKTKLITKNVKASEEFVINVGQVDEEY